MVGSRSALLLAVTGSLSLTAISTVKGPEDQGEELVCRGPFRYATIQMSVGADGSPAYRLSLRVRMANEPAGTGESLEPGECGWPGRLMSAGSKGNTQLISELPVREVVLEFALDEIGRANITRAEHRIGRCNLTEASWPSRLVKRVRQGERTMSSPETSSYGS